MQHQKHEQQPQAERQGDPAIDYTETHQVIVSVGYGTGPEVAERLEENNIIVNYQATPEEEGFTASGALRMGVSEMTRFGFGPAEFDELASLMADCILRGKDISEDVVRLRSRFTKMHYCFNDAEFNAALDRFAGDDETEHRKKLEEERYRSNYDSLTGLFNREHFYETVEQQIVANPNVKYSILCADIQNFKIINDVFGIERGDAVLRSLANMFRNLATGDTVLARLSADRFAVCVRDEKLNHERYLEELDLISHIGDNNSYHARIYTGICPIRNIKTPISVYCDRAFLAIESIKGDYQQSIAYYDDELRKQMLERQHMVSDFRSAIAKQEFRLYLQPQVDEQGTMLGAEALVRWFRPVHGMMLPEEFVDVFEKSGLISAMDQYVWELACKELQRWKAMGKEQYYISVNVSPKDFYFLDIYTTLTTLVECYEIDPDKLRLEITETSVMKDANKHLALIDDLRTYGFRVVMDDFGRGYSSLNMLQDMNLDAIKIDMEFLRRNEDPERSRMILEMVLNLAKELDIHVVTEGVEQKDQLQYMQELGCTLFQGYYFAKPMPVNQFEKTYF